MTASKLPANCRQIKNPPVLPTPRDLQERATNTLNVINPSTTKS